MDERKKILLNIIIKEHIKTGIPVGSNIIVEKYNLKISPATVRNEMANLENEGFIAQPHTSAGRVPTEKAYRFYISHLGKAKNQNSDYRIFNKILEQKNESSFKIVAKEMVKFSNNAVFWAFHKHNLYYTGISNLLAQPEFAQSDLIYDISTIIDRLDEIIDSIFNDIKFGSQILLGSENPFSDVCGVIIMKYKFAGNVGIFGILGPMRMNYEKNLNLVETVGNKLRG